MELLKLPKDFDFMMFVNCMFLFMIAFFLMTFNNGESTIQYINKLNLVFPSLSNSSINNLSSIPLLNFSDYQTDNTIGKVMKYQSDLIKQDIKLPYIILFIYWIILPIFNICYGIYCFKKGLLIGTKQYNSMGKLNYGKN